jgi:hypothetical protein
MEISNIMKKLTESRDAEQTAVKTAAVQAPNSDTLRTALRAALTTEKTASATPQQDVTSGLFKMAEDLASAEQDALQKQAELYGAAICDGFMTRFGQYEKAAMDAGVQAPKYAQAQPQDATLDAIKTAAADPAFTKFASENPDLVKEAFELGYQAQWNELVKTANDEFTQGYNDTMTEVHKIASAVYAHGAYSVNDVIRAAQAQQ